MLLVTTACSHAQIPTAYVQGGPKTDTLCFVRFLFALISSNIDRFSNLFHCLNQENICNNTFAKDLTTPHVCRYNTL